MTLEAGLTPADREAVQLHLLRRYLAARVRLVGRRRGDLPIRGDLSRSQVDRYWRWLSARRQEAAPARQAGPGEAIAAGPDL